MIIKPALFLLSGEIEECEHVKSMLGKLARNSFAASFGVNDDWSAALAVIAIVELVLIIATLIVKVFSFPIFINIGPSLHTRELAIVPETSPCYLGDPSLVAGTNIWSLRLVPLN